MKYINLNLFYFILIVPLLSCQKTNTNNRFVDNNSYINDFELIQQNPENSTRIKITSPNAIIDPANNDIEIYDSKIIILDKDEETIEVKSGQSTLNNSTNLIKAYQSVIISFITKNNSYIKTNSLEWDLSTSNINLNSPIDINFKDTSILSSNGIYDIESSELKINNNIFKRCILNKEGKRKFQIQVISDKANWFKNENSLEFSSDIKQVETTIDFLRIK